MTGNAENTDFLTVIEPIIDPTIHPCARDSYTLYIT